MKTILAFFTLAFMLFQEADAQLIYISDDFESAEDGLDWTEDNAAINPNFDNPYPSTINPSAKVMRYADYGAEYGNVRLDMPINFDLSENSTFSLKIYIESQSLTGSQTNQVSVKLQNGALAQAWTTQTEIIKTVVPDVWQELSFDFSSDDFINFNLSSPDPTERFDLNRILIQVNGEANTDLVTAYIDDFSYDGFLDPDANPTASVYNNLVWSDEFEGEGAVNPEKWHHQTLLPNGNSWFNNEVQHYTDRVDNSFVEDGFLHIVAKNETFTDQGVTKNYTSARLNSKFAFTYGRVVARAKLPEGVGTWPAIWMLGKNIAENGGYWADEFGTTGWPECGEIDIMEHWGDNQNVISAALHTPSSFGATENYATVFDEDVSEEFHIYEMEWSPEEIKFSLNGSVFYTYAPQVQNADTWPFTADQYILLNVAMEANTSPNFSQSEMVLDYVRVYQEGEPTAVREAEPLDLLIYPNPASDFLTIAAPFAGDNALVEIFSVTGKRVLMDSVSGQRSQISITALPAGVYSVSYRSDLGFARHPFVKIR